MVRLTDSELMLLDGQVSDKVQAEVDQAKRRLRAADKLGHLSPILAGLIADIVADAQTHGRLVYRPERIPYCTLCGSSPDPAYVPYKSGPNKGLPNYKKPRYLNAQEFAWRFVTVRNSVRVGGCTDCVKPILPDIREALRGVPAEVPDTLRAEGEPVRKRHANRHCLKCDWTGHEGEMIWERTIMGDGRFPSKCPVCEAGGAWSRDIEQADGFVVVEQNNGSEVQQ